MEKLAVDGGPKVREAPWPSRKPFGDEEIAQVTEALRSQNLFYHGGAKAKQFEKEFAELLGVKHAIMGTSGTAAVHMAVGALNPEPGSEIIVGPVTDIGSIIGIVAQGCVPIFADWKPGAHNMDPADVARKISERTAAVMAIHLMGTPVAIDEILQACAPRQIPVIEDCAQSYLAQYQGKCVGTIGTIGAFSLQASKHINSGEGGISITDSDELGEALSLFRDKGWDRNSPGARNYASFGMNYRPSELNAAVALAQLPKLAGIVEKRRQLANRLDERIKDVPGVEHPLVPTGANPSFWFYTLRITGYDPQRFAEAFGAEGCPIGVGYTGEPIYLCSDIFTRFRTFGASGYPFTSPYYQGQVEYGRGLCPVAERELRQMALLPLHEDCGEREVDDIARAVHKITDALPRENA